MLRKVFSMFDRSVKVYQMGSLLALRNSYLSALKFFFYFRFLKVLNRQRKSSYTFQMNVSDDGTLLKPNGDGYVLYKGNSLSVNYTCHAYILGK